MSAAAPLPAFTCIDCGCTLHPGESLQCPRCHTTSHPHERICVDCKDAWTLEWDENDNELNGSECPTCGSDNVQTLAQARAGMDD